MPKMSYDMQQGTVVRWLKNEGDDIVSGEVIAEIETDKATVEMPAYVNGVMGRIVVETGRSVPVGELIAIITAQGEELPPVSSLNASESASSVTPAQVLPSSDAAPLAGSPAPNSNPVGEVRASPIARRLARERGLDLTQVAGSGPGGRIVEADILALQHAASARNIPTRAAAPRGPCRGLLIRVPSARARTTRTRTCRGRGRYGHSSATSDARCACFHGAISIHGTRRRHLRTPQPHEAGHC